MQRLSSILATIAFGVGLNTMPAHADDVDDPPDPLNQGRLSFSLGADITSEYFFRGYLQEDQGLIFQPWAGRVAEGEPAAMVLGAEKVLIGDVRGFADSPHPPDTLME